MLGVLGVGVFLLTNNRISETTSTTTQAQPNVLWADHLVNITDGSWITATLSPLGKANYNAQGSVQLMVCPILNNTILCPTIEVWVMNKTGFTTYQQSGLTTSPYGMVTIAPTLGAQSDFTLHKLDNDGTYYFVFMVLQQGHPLISGTHATISISLTETWAET